MVKEVCWNCVHCDTFGGICFKGKFNGKPMTRLEIHSCNEFESAYREQNDKLVAEVERLKQEVERLKEYEYMYNDLDR